MGRKAKPRKLDARGYSTVSVPAKAFTPELSEHTVDGANDVPANTDVHEKASGLMEMECALSDAHVKATGKPQYEYASEVAKPTGLLVKLMCADGINKTVNTAVLKKCYGEDSPLYKCICGTADLQGSSTFPYESWVLDGFIHIGEHGKLPKGFFKLDPDRQSKTFTGASDFFLCDHAKNILSVLKNEQDKQLALRREQAQRLAETQAQLRGDNRVSAKGLAARNRADRYEKYENAMAKYL